MKQMRRFRDVAALTLEALDGELGAVEDLYMDDRNWAVRYLVVKTGGWLFGRQVLIAPASVRDIDDQARRLRINLTKEQIEHSPPIDTAQTVSRAYEEAYYRHFRLAPYWDTVPGPSVSAVPYPGTVPPSIERTPSTEPPETPHLRSGRELTGDNIQTPDGPIGHVEDVVIDDEEWVVRYLEVDTSTWLPGKKVLVRMSHIDRIEWAEQAVVLTLARQAIEGAPPYDPSELITPDYEVRLFTYYSQTRAA
jgi:sporulation protein YlmC with PRC-barrel domain